MRITIEDRYFVGQSYPELRSPISGEAMTDPVKASDGALYERSELERRFEKYTDQPIPSSVIPGVFIDRSYTEIDPVFKKTIIRIYSRAPTRLPNAKIDLENNMVLHVINSRLRPGLELTQYKWSVAIIRRKNFSNPQILLEGVLEEPGRLHRPQRYLAFIYLKRDDQKEHIFHPHLEGGPYWHESDFDISTQNVRIVGDCIWDITNNQGIQLINSISESTNSEIKKLGRLQYLFIKGHTDFSWIQKQLVDNCNIDSRNILDLLYPKEENHRKIFSL